MQPINNYVVLKPAQDTSKIKTSIGELYIDNSFSPEQYTDIVFEVVKTPRSLNFTLDGQHPCALDWECDMELKVGDLVWTTRLASLKATRLDGNYLIPYAKLTIAQRDGEIIPLNGNILIEPITEIPALQSTLIILDDKPVEKKERGIVKYIGKPNHRYRDDRWHDDIDVKVGDSVILRKMGYSKLEFSPFHKLIGNYFVAQRRNVMAIQQ